MKSESLKQILAFLTRILEKNDFNEGKLLIVSTILANPPNRKKYVITTFKGFSNKFLYSIYTFKLLSS